MQDPRPERSVKELRYHARVLDLMKLDTSAKIQIHLGGMYGDKAKSMRRFIKRFNELGERIQKRLTYLPKPGLQKNMQNGL